MSRPATRGGRNTGGFSLAELLIVTVLGSLIIASAFQLFISQSQLFVVQREVLDARESVRSATSVLAGDLREVASSDGDLYSAQPDSLVVRSIIAGGTICSHGWNGPGLRRVGIQHASGLFDNTPTDSLLAYIMAEGTWAAFGVNKTWEPPAAWMAAPGGGGTPVCFWGDSTIAQPRPQYTAELDGDPVELAKLLPGAPVRAFRRTKYALFKQEGRWYLGRRVGNALGWDLLTGPMLAPENGGLEITYFDASGIVTTIPARVVRVALTLRAESAGRSTSGTQVDSITTIVFLRNN